MERKNEKLFSKQLRQIGDLERKYLNEVLESGWQTCLFNDEGFVRRFETEFARFVGGANCLARANGMLSLAEAVSVSGAKAGNEIICDPVVHFGALASLYFNCIPRFCDIDPDTYLMDTKSLEANITDNTKAVIVTHLWGLPARIDEIRDICDKRGLFLIEDCAHAVGARWNGQHVGTFGNMAMFSFQEFKQLSTGDGAMTVIRDKVLAEKLVGIWGFSGESPLMMTLNWRMNEVTGAMGLAQLQKIQGILDYYKQTLDMFNEAIVDCKWLANRRTDANAQQAGYWFACRWDGDKYGLDYNRFKQLNDELKIGLRFGFNTIAPYQYEFFRKGDIYGNGVPFHTEPFTKLSNYRYKDGLCPVVEEIMPRFITVNLIFAQHEKVRIQIESLRKAIDIMNKG